MPHKKLISILVLLILIFVTIASLTGILSNSGSGEYEFTSIHGQVINIYGKGIYKHMSSDVAIQGIAQDYVTLLIAAPYLLITLFRSRKGSVKGRLLMSGVLLYIFLTYLFYMNMAMYNSLFLVYIAITGLSFFALATTLLSIDTKQLIMSKKTPVKFIGGFLIFNAISIALLWLGVIVPPLIDQSIVPLSVEHYSTLNVQAFDLSLFLPLSFVAGWLLIKAKALGRLMAPVYLVFLSLLMTALIAKIIAMGFAGVNIIPAVFIIPCIAIVAIICKVMLIKNIN